MANGINQLAIQANLQFQTQRATSGFGTPTLGPFSETFTQSVTSGQVFATQLSLASGASQQYDFISGNLTDVQGNTVQLTTFHGLTVNPASGSINLQTAQSGGLNWPFLSGGGAVIPPGGNLTYGEQIASGYGFTPAAGVGNLKFQANSGPCLLSFGVWGR